MQRYKIFALFAVGGLFFVFYPSAVQGCSIRPPSIVVEADINQEIISNTPACLDENCKYTLYAEQSKYYRIGLTNMVDENWVASVSSGFDKIELHSWGDTQAQENIFNDRVFLNALDALVVQDIDFSFSEWNSITTSWEVEESRGTFLKGDLTIRPYDAELAETYKDEKTNDLLQCNYNDVTKAGSWMFISATSRDYCQSIEGRGGMCPSVGISYVSFVKYLFNDVSSVTIPYIIGFILFAAITLFLVVYIIYKREWTLFFKPSKTVIVLLFIAFIYLVLLSYFNDWRGLIIQLLEVFLLLSLVQYIIRKISKRRRIQTKPKQEN